VDHQPDGAQKIPGVSIALVDSQEVVWAQDSAMLMSRRCSRHHRNRLSHRVRFETFTAAAVMQYVEQGYLDLDAPFTNYTPDVSWKERYPAARSVTVRDLLAHHSGLPGDLIRAGFLTQPLGEGYANTTGDLSETYPLFEPGVIDSYCNAAFVLLEGVIEDAAERASGSVRPFEQIVDDALFARWA
jgi:CubicO group peptidase (beta-lactamase class C family)